jgi:colanic acid biosynthesis glycosyl transferase WcaI
MNLLFLTEIYPPEPMEMMAELTGHLRRAGWAVTVVTGLPTQPGGSGYERYGAFPLGVEQRDGVTVVRAWHPTLSSRGFLPRSATAMTKAMATAVTSYLPGRVDVVLTYRPPLIGPLLGWTAARRHGARMANLIWDIYPDIAIDTGLLRNPAAIAAARAAERQQYRRADVTIVPCEGFRKMVVERGADPERVRVVPVWIDPEEIRPGRRKNAWSEKNRVPLDRFIVLFSGTIGLVSNAPVIADAANLLRDTEAIHFLVIGEGAMKEALMGRARQLGLTNMSFLPRQPREALSDQMKVADVGLVTLGKGRGYTSYPSKPLAYMAAGKPVLAGIDADCDLGRELGEHGSGLVVAPEDPAALAAGIEKLAGNRALRTRLGKAGRKRVGEHFNRERVLTRLDEILRDLM